MTDDDPKTPPSLTDIDARLRAARGRPEGGRDGGDREGPNRPSGAGLAFRIGVELVTTTLVGTAIGYGLDVWLGTAPWLMIVFLLLGGAAGVSNVYRVVKGLDDAVGLGQAVERKKQDEDRRAAPRGGD